MIGVRENFLGRLISEFDNKLPDFLQDNKLINLRPLQAVDARMAILRPLRDVPKVGYDPQFVDSILIPQLVRQSAGENVIEPSQLQIVCTRLYLAAQQKLSDSHDEGQGFLIDQNLYNELGGARGILERYLDEVVNRVAEGKTEQIKLVRSILKLMIQSGNARKFISLDDLKRNLPDVT